MDLGLDIDGVLYPFDRALALQVEAARGLEPGSLPPALEWDFFLGWGMTEDEYRAAYAEGVETGTLFTALPPYPGAVEAVRGLAAAGHRIHYVTARGSTDAEVRRLHADTDGWLRRWGFPIDSLTVTWDKPGACRGLGVRLFLDDAPHQYDALEAAGLEPWLLDRPWNAAHPGRRVASVGAFGRVARNPCVVTALS